MALEHDVLETLSDRLTHALDITSTRKADLARAIDVKPQVIQFLCNSKTKSSRFSFEIATALGLNTRWLATGEGAMFLADDPKHKMLANCKITKVLPSDALLTLARHHNVQVDTLPNWQIIQSDEEDLYCTQLLDTSMTPKIPARAHIFFKLCVDYTPAHQDIVLVYLANANTVLVREVVAEKNNQFMLVPQNLDLFKAIPVNHHAAIFAIVTDCHWKLRRPTHERHPQQT